MRNLKDLLTSAKVVSLYNYSDYEERFSRNGGKYGFQMLFSNLGKKWTITYYTTADMDFCNLCGEFITPSDEEHNCERQIVSTNELIKIIDDFKSSNKYLPDTAVIVDGEIIWEGSEREEEEDEEEIELENIYMDEEGEK